MAVDWRAIGEAAAVFTVAALSTAGAIAIAREIERSRREREAEFRCGACDYPVYANEPECPQCGCEFEPAGALG